MKSPFDSLPGYGSVLRRFLPYIRPQWRLIVLAFAAMIAETALRLLEPWPLKFIIEQIIKQQGSAGETFASLSPMALLTVMAVAAVAITGLRSLAAYGETMAFSVAASRVATEVRGGVYRHLQRLSLAFHAKARGGDLTTRLIMDTSRMEDATVTAVAPLLSNTVMLLGMVGVMFWLNWQMAVISVIALPLFAWMTVRYTAAIQDSSQRQRSGEGSMASTAAESLNAIKVVQSLSLEEELDDTFARHNEAGLALRVRAKRLEASLERSVDVLVAVSTAAVLWFGARQVLHGNMTAGDLIVFLTYAKSGFRPVKDIAKFTGRIAKAAASGERILAILDTAPDIVEVVGARQAGTLKGRIAFEQVTFEYEPGRPVLNDVSFVIEPGENVAFMGASGAGKSTIMNLLLRLYEPTEGRITVDGFDIREFTLASLRGQVAIVLQDSVLFAVSARENIAYGALGASDDEVLAAARLANADEFIRALPDGYETVLGERGATLSGGQRQRIAIARAAVRRSPIVVLDEPTTGLDKKNEREVTAALARLTERVTTLTIAHDPGQVSGAGRVIVLEGGRIVESGAPAELVAAGGRFAGMVRRRAPVAGKDDASRAERNGIAFRLPPAGTAPEHLHRGRSCPVCTGLRASGGGRS